MLLALPTASLAATYHYVNTSGEIQDTNAANAEQALAQAINIAPHSGVVLDMGFLNAGDSASLPGGTTTDANYPSGTYQYINVNGDVKTVVAANASEALVAATGLALHSGVVNIAATGTAISPSADVPL